MIHSLQLCLFFHLFVLSLYFKSKASTISVEQRTILSCIHPRKLSCAHRTVFLMYCSSYVIIQTFRLLERNDEDLIEPRYAADNAYSIWSTWSCYWLDQFLTLKSFGNKIILAIIISEEHKKTQMSRVLYDQFF